MEGLNKFLDSIVSNKFVFVFILIVLITLLGALVLAIINSFKNKRIPIGEEKLDEKELDGVKEDNIIDHPKKKKKHKHKDEEKEDVVEAIEEESMDEEEEPVIPNEEPNREELENIDDAVIEERFSKEREEDYNETIENVQNNELAEALNELKETEDLTPEEVVRKFEEEQEAQSIISYQELVDVVKNRDNDFEDELESKPLATVSDFMVDVTPSEGSNKDMVELLEEIDKPKEQSPVLDEIEEIFEMPKVETLKEIPDEGKFKKTEVISPVFGRISDPESVEELTPVIEEAKVENLIADIEELEVIPSEDKIEELETIEPAFEDLSDTITQAEEEQIKLEIKSFLAKKKKEQEKKENEIEELEEVVPKKKNDVYDTVALGDISSDEDFLKALKDFKNTL